MVVVVVVVAGRTDDSIISSLREKCSHALVVSQLVRCSVLIGCMERACGKDVDWVRGMS